VPAKVVRKRGGRLTRPKTKLEVPGDPRLMPRNWAKRGTGWLQERIFGFALLAAMLWLLSQLLTSPDFQVKLARVYGNQIVPTDTISQAASVPKESILLADSKKIRDSVMKLPQIKEARVKTQFPNRVEVFVTERPPSYVWKVKDTLYLASEDGILLGTSDKTGQLVALVDVDARPVSIGDRLDNDALAAASKLSFLLPRQLGITPGYFEYTSKEGVVLPTSFAGRVIFGQSEDIQEKVVAFKAISDKIRQDGLKVQMVDLRYKDKPYFK